MAVEAQEKLVLACPGCLTANRVPAARIADDPKCGKCGAPVVQGHPVALDDASFEPFLSRSDLPVVVDFWADWCAPCRAMAPVFERLAGDLKTQVRFAKVDTEQARSVAARFGIRAIPTMIAFRRGRELARTSGAMDARTLQAWVEAATRHS